MSNGSQRFDRTFCEADAPRPPRWSTTVLLLCALLGLGCQDEPNRPSTLAGTGELAPAVSESVLAGVEQAIAQREYHETVNRRGLQAPNRRHDLRTYFAPEGIQVVDRSAAGSPRLVALSLSRIERGGEYVTIEPGVVSHSGPRVEISRAEQTLVEWYQNGPAGLEQGFTFGERPAGVGELELEVAVDGATVSALGDGLVFHSETGRQLRYDGLYVEDARGVAMPARFAATESSFRIVVDDRGAVFPLTIDPLLTQSFDSEIESDQADALLGQSVASAGDVNGDGYADVIVGAPRYDSGENDEGAAFIFLGGASGIAGSNPTNAHAQIESNQADANLGISVASAGDVDGDGYGDIIVGANLYDSGESDEGAAFVFLGSASGIADGNPATAHAQLESDQAFARLGRSVASAGDINGDGYGDVIVGAYFYDAGENNEGAAFLFLGSASGIVGNDPATAHTQLESNQAGANLGYSVASAGDVNADGFGDVIVGADLYETGFQDEGAAFVFLGSASGIADGNPATADAQLEANQSQTSLGRSVASAGDVNGDGYGDVVIGALRYDAGESDEGAAFVFLGSASGIADGNPATAHAQLESDQAFANMGTSVASAGDVNGDGYADLIIGAHRYDAGENNEGAAFVFFGSATGIADGNPATADAQLESNQGGTIFGSNLGTSVASAGDVDGDGYDDVIVGALLFDGPESDEGHAFIYHGGATGIVDGNPMTAHAQIESNLNLATLGRSVASAGDVNGDGFGDIIVGARAYDAGEIGEGAAFVFLGSASGIAGSSAATAHAQLESNQKFASMGTSVASAGDVNGDGFGDVIVGAKDYNAGEFREGVAFIFLGSAAGIIGNDPTTAHAQLESNQESAFLGDRGSVASAGDVNGDGFGDVIVGAYSYDAGEVDEGAAFVFLGSASGIADGSPATAHAQLESNQVAGSGLNLSVASAGDVNGDGFGDVIVGALGYTSPEGSEGAAFVYLGSASGIVGNDPASAHAQLESDQVGGGMGSSVASAGDVNGDGYGDIIVGAFGYDAGENNEGAAFVFLGSASGIVGSSPASADTQIESDLALANLGHSVASAGDVNGDGYGDVIVGAPYFAAGEFDEGAAFVFLGGTSGIADGNPTTAYAQLESDQESSFLGWGVASAGDVNGDGFGDVIVGAWGYDAGEADEGAAFVFLGQPEGRLVRPQQRRGDGSGIPVQPDGSSYGSIAFQVEMLATSARGRERARLEVEACPAGTPFGGVACSPQSSPSWVDLGTTGTTLTKTLVGLTEGEIYHWRARVLTVPFFATEPGITPSPHAGPWRRIQGRAAPGDIRLLPEPGLLVCLTTGLVLLWILGRRGRGVRAPA